MHVVMIPMPGGWKCKQVRCCWTQNHALETLAVDGTAGIQVRLSSACSHYASQKGSKLQQLLSALNGCDAMVFCRGVGDRGGCFLDEVMRAPINNSTCCCSDRMSSMIASSVSVAWPASLAQQQYSHRCLLTCMHVMCRPLQGPACESPVTVRSKQATAGDIHCGLEGNKMCPQQPAACTSGSLARRVPILRLRRSKKSLQLPHASLTEKFPHCDQMEDHWGS